MSINYQNVSPEELNLTAAISLPADNAEKIIELLKESDVKCIAESNDKTISITFDIADIEKLNKLLQPFGIDKQLNNSAIKLPEVNNKEKLVPIANAMTNLYDRKINSRHSRAEAHRRHIGIISSALDKNKAAVQSLSDKNFMLQRLLGPFTFFNNPINALIKQNEKKIERLNNNVPKLKKQIELHRTTIDKLNKSTEHLQLRKNACKHLSDVVKSFFIQNKKERNQNYILAVSALNNDMLQINNEKINKCISAIGKIGEEFPKLSPAGKENAQERLNSLVKTQNSLERKNKVCLPLLVSCELDEFANIGKLPNFNETLAVVRSYNIRICIVIQGLSMLKAMYEKTWDSIVGNCSIFTFLGTNDTDSLDYVSKKLGKTTVKVDTRSYNRGSSQGGGGGSDSENYIQRDLLAPDEIKQAVKPKGTTKRYGGSCIIFIDEYRPFYMPKFDSMSHPLFKDAGSKYPGGIPNNTYITDTYAKVKAERSSEYKHYVQKVIMSIKK